jgi:hypothetical protein
LIVQIGGDKFLVRDVGRHDLPLPVCENVAMVWELFLGPAGGLVVCR